MKKVAVPGSGNGSNFEAIVRYFRNQDVEFTCISDKKDSYILKRAEDLGIKSFYVPFKDTYSFLQDKGFDLISLAGYMRILPPEIVNSFKIINIHPSLLPEFKGKDAIKRAYDSGAKITGVTVHQVVEEVDAGQIIAQLPVIIKDKMTLEELEKEIHRAEHELYPKVIDHLLFNNSVKIQLNTNIINQEPGN